MCAGCVRDVKAWVPRKAPESSQVGAAGIAPQNAAMNPATPLSDAELTELEQLLDSLPAPLEPLDISALDGYLCGVLLQPQPVPASQWLRWVGDVEGQALPKGKYGFFTIPGENEWTLVFSKTWNQWGTYRYKQEDDALRVKVKAGTSSSLTEKLTYAINNGKVSLKWENADITFNVGQ